MRRFVRVVGSCWILALAISWASAEVRTWTVTTTSSAEFVSIKNGTTAVLQRPDGTTFEVPLDQLSEADRKYIRDFASTSASAASKATTSARLSDGRKVSLNVPESIATVELEAMECRSADDAVHVYKFFLSKPDTSDDVRKAAEERLKYWVSLANKDCLRIGDRWVTPEEADEIRQKTEDMVQHGIELLRIKNYQLAREELQRASKLNPEDEKADFLMGWVYMFEGMREVAAARGLAAVKVNINKGVQHFSECIKRSPNSAYAYNNLAVCEFFADRYTLSLAHFRRAMELAPDSQPISDNLGSTIEAAGNGKWRVNIPKKTLDEFNDLYRMALRELKLKPLTKSGVLWMVTPYGKAWDRTGADNFDGFFEAPPDTVTGIASGTGFVIAPGYVLTNYHVIDDGSEISILDPKDNKTYLVATVVASQKKPDLALLRCPELSASPLAIAGKLPRRGTDIMALGYPYGSRFGLEIKTTRGAIISTGDSGVGGGCMHSAQVNPGNSGGPIVDQQGRVVAVVVALLYSHSGAYGIGISVDHVWEFLAKHLPEVKPVNEESKALEWPDVDAKVSPSTVYIMVKIKGKPKAK